MYGNVTMRDLTWFVEVSRVLHAGHSAHDSTLLTCTLPKQGATQESVYLTLGEDICLMSA